MDKKIRYGVIGLGYIAQAAVLPAFKNAKENSELTALISGDAEKLKILGEKYQVDKLYLYSQFEDCLRNKEIDALYIATPNFYHRNIMETAAKYGVHVLCEKPMSVTVEDCYSMLNAAELNHIKLMVAYRLHFESANLEAIKYAHSREMGELKIFNALFTMNISDKKNVRLADSTKGGGALYDIGIYCINAARYLFKSEPTEVFAFSTEGTDARFKNIPESVSVTMKFPKNRLATFSLSFGAFDSADYDLIGTKSRIRLEKGFNYASPMVLKIFHGKKLSLKRFGKRDQFAPELIYFSDCILKNKRPEPSGEEGLIDIKIIEAIQLSLDLKGPITLDVLSNKNRPNIQQKISRPLSERPDIYHARGPSH